MVRAKFRVESLNLKKDGAELVMEPVTGKEGEDADFWKWTPYGKIVIGLVSHDTAKKFIPGECYYVDFTHVVPLVS